MTIKNFIEKAIEGGWNGIWLETFKPFTSERNYQYIMHRILLDPKAWKCAGFEKADMTRMVEHLWDWDSGTIEEYLKTL